MTPYSWYLEHILVGARETELPWEYVRARITPINAVADPDPEREARERAIHNN